MKRRIEANVQGVGTLSIDKGFVFFETTECAITGDIYHPVTREEARKLAWDLRAAAEMIEAHLDAFS